MSSFWEKISIFTAKISDDFFVINFVSQILPVFTESNFLYDDVYGPFFTRKTSFS